jgi:hypothetical protein
MKRSLGCPARSVLQRAFAMASLAVLGLVSGCASNRGPFPGLMHPTDNFGTSFVFDSAVVRSSDGDFDTAVVIGLARNVSADTLRLCCRFDFEGGFASSSACPGQERSPVFYLLGRSTTSSTSLNCRSAVLEPGAVFADSVTLRLYRPDFARCPGRIRLDGGFWLGQPGKSFAEASLQKAQAVQVSFDEP